MGIALRGVEEEIADSRARDVHVLRRNIGEDDARSDFWRCPFACRLEEVLFAKVGEAKEPEDGSRTLGKDTEPGAEGRGLDLETS